MHVVSGSDDVEFKGLCKCLEVEQFFISINGSLSPKTELVRNIIINGDINVSEYCLIGDTINDYHAAKNNSFQFFWP
jgi:histidinol phosphatase-like enzyme